MSVTMTLPSTELSAGHQARLSCDIGEIESEPVLALLVKLPSELTLRVTADSDIGGVWNWSYLRGEGDAGLAFELEISVGDQPALRDRLIFQVGPTDAMEMLRCLMRQSCLPVIFVDDGLVEVERVAFSWSAEDRSEVASLASIALSCSYPRRDGAPGPMVGTAS